MFGKKIKLNDELYDKAKKYAETAGYSSVDEFITHIIEKEIQNIEQDGDSLEEVEKRLKGLGYIS
jgi:predicted CopG family antitoxin